MTKQRPRSLFLAGLVLLASGWFSGASCGGPGASAPTSPGPSATATPLSTAVARYLYLLQQQGGGRASQLQIFRVDGNTGELVEVPGSPATGVTPFYRLPMHPSGRFLYGTRNLRPFEGWSIDEATGLLRSMPGVPFAKNFGSVEMVVAAAGRFGYFPSVKSPSGIEGYALDPTTGVPSVLAGSPFGPILPGGTIEPVYTTYVCAPAQRRLYCVAQRNPTQTTDIVAVSFAQEATGGLTDVRVESPLVAQTTASFWLIQAVGDRFVYAAKGTLIYGFRIENSGALTVIPGFPIESGPLQSERLVQLVAHPSGRFLYAVAGNFIITGPDVGHVDGFEIDQQTGALRPIVGSPFLANNFVSTGQADHIQMVFEPNGRFALFAVGGAILRVSVEPSGALRSGGAAIRQPMTNTDIALASW